MIGNGPGQKHFCKRLIHRLYETISSLWSMTIGPLMTSLAVCR
jgi:hypothetical protein